MLAYLLRLICLCLASFFLVHLALGLTVLLLSNPAVRVAARLRPHIAARFLLTLRLFPSGSALLLVLLVFMPSYLWLEPAGLEPTATPEHVSLLCIAIAALGAAVWAVSIFRTLRAAGKSTRHIRYYRQTGHEVFFQDSAIPVWEIEGPSPFVMLAGILKSRLIISSRVVKSLTPEQLSTVLNHELIHSQSRDNLKRLLVMLSPGVIPYYRGFAALERGWANVVEWAADDGAVAGEPERSLALAAALVQVARLGAAPAPVPLATSLMSDDFELATRVDRLLRRLAPPPPLPARTRLFLRGATALAAGSTTVLLLRPATFYAAHEFLEALIR